MQNTIQIHTAIAVKTVQKEMLLDCTTHITQKSTQTHTHTHNHCDNEISEKMSFDCTTHNTQNITQIHKTITVMKCPKKMLLDYATQECSAIMLFSEVLCNNDI